MLVHIWFSGMFINTVLQEMRMKIEEVEKMRRRLPRIEESLAEAQVGFEIRQQMPAQQ
jgi:hypothetical protein